MAKKLKATELFLSLGLVASLVTACGAPSADDATTEPDETGTTESVEGAPDAAAPDAAAPDAEEGGEGGEGGEG
jgi:hypothetical protein